MKKSPKKIVNPNLHKIYICYRESRSGGESDSGERYSSRSDLHVEYALVQATLERPTTWYYESFDIEYKEKPDDIFVVLVRYKSGDSFGSSYGNGCIVNVFLTKDEAMAVTESIDKGTYENYAPWTGYFERLESVNCYVMKLRETEKDPIRID